VRQGRTDAWIAHKLDVSIEQLERFKRDHDLEGDGGAPGRPADPLSVPPPEADLYEESEEEEEEEEQEEPEPIRSLIDETEAEDEPPRAPRGGGRGRAATERSESEEGTAPARRRRRGRRGGRRRRRPSSYEATFDHGEEGYGLWLDPAVVENPVYAQHWAGHREVQVTFDADAITIRRANTAAVADEEAEEPDGEDR
jgi:hypothetical protein